MTAHATNIMHTAHTPTLDAHLIFQWETHTKKHWEAHTFMNVHGSDTYTRVPLNRDSPLGWQGQKKEGLEGPRPAYASSSLSSLCPHPFAGCQVTAGGAKVVF